MVNNDYLNELGIFPENYSTNFATGDRKHKKKWKEQQKKYGFDDRKCYDLGRTFAEDLYSCLHMFLDNVEEFQDIDHNGVKINFNGEEYTERQAILYTMGRLEKSLLLESDEEQKDAELNDNEILDDSYEDNENDEDNNLSQNIITDIDDEEEEKDPEEIRAEVNAARKDAILMWAELAEYCWW